MNRRKKLMIFLGVALGMVILLPIIHHYQLRFAVAAYVAELKAKSEPFDLAQAMPPAVPTEQNGADDLREADRLFGEAEDLDYINDVAGMRMIAPGKAMVCWQQQDIRNSDETNSWENVEAIVARNESAFAVLRQIIQKPSFDFQINYSAGIARLEYINLCLPQSKRSAERLQTAIECDLHQGDTGAAVTDLHAMLALVKAMKDERLAITEMVRIAISQIAVRATWEILQSSNLTDKALVELQNDWNRLDFIHAGENALAMERLTGEISLEKERVSYSELRHYLDLGVSAGTAMSLPDQVKTAIVEMHDEAAFFFWRYWWSYSDELRYLKGIEVLTETLRAAATKGSFQDALVSQGAALNRLGISGLNDELASIFSGEMDFHSMLSQSVVTLSGFAKKVMRVEVARAMITTAIALKRYQLKHGNYPPHLDSLVTEFIATIPLDPVDGNPLRYRRNSDGTILLYSVGENGKDDGGDPTLEKRVNNSAYSWENPHALDWVWPRPATDAEIKTYYESRPRGSD